MDENADKTIVKRFKKTNEVLAKYGLHLKKSKLTRKILNEPNSKKPEKAPEDESPQNLETPKRAAKTPQNANSSKSETPASKKGHRMTFEKSFSKNPVIRTGSDVRQTKVLDLTPETPQQKRSTKSAAKNLFPEARAKRREDIFDVENESESPVIKFSGNTRAFNTTTQKIEKSYVKSPARKSIGNGRAEKIMSLVENSLDETRNKTFIIKKDCKNKLREENMLKKSCLDEKLTVRIKPIEQLLDLDKHEVMKTEVASPAKALPVAQSTLSKTKISKFQPLNESTISGEETRKTMNNTSLRSGDEIPLNFTSMSSKQKWNWLLTIPKNERKNQDWDAFHDLTDYNQARGFAEAGEIINIDDDEEQLYRKLLFKHKMDILKSRC